MVFSSTLCKSNKKKEQWTKNNEEFADNEKKLIFHP